MQFGITLFCYIGLIIAIKHMTVSDNALLDSVKDNLARVVTTVEKVKGASNFIVDGVTVVRELAEENKQSAEEVVDSMENLSGQNYTLSQLLQDKALQGTIIRASNDNGTCIVGCRMAEDNEQIMEYVKAKI